MLVLSRKKGEEIRLGDNIRLIVLSVCGKKVRIGVDAIPEIPVHRQELINRNPSNEAIRT